MAGIIIVAIVVLAAVAALEYNHRRNVDPISATGSAGGWTRNDRDVARIKLDLLATGGRTEPFSPKPLTFGSIRHPHVFSHGRHAA